MNSIPAAVYDDLVKRYGHKDIIRITAPKDTLQIKQVAYASKKKQEHFIVVTLNAASEVIKCRTITIGLLNHSLVHAREIFRSAITDNAAAIICVHNHPSGNTEPSSQDINITKMIKDAGEIIGISLLDHLIVSQLGLVSLRELGYL